MFQCSDDTCPENHLGILCRCTEYRDIVNKFTFYTVGTQHYLTPNLNVEPIASAKVSWINTRLRPNEDISKPVLHYFPPEKEISASNIDKVWIPVVPDLVSLKLRRK